ncbi:hypothetical protein [Allorhizocola rhizosphaerae]|uniref:hypothetical protein n=1 Tax=Allorhizocola rhizosphaerae TaxID=1872709 RepID=UPI000E3CAA82|nr:hypothetical protein [Allorhizocola rhizosphaerae]
MEVEAAVTVRELIANNLSRLRNEARVPIERVAQAASAMGLGWSPAWLQAIEQGQKSLTSEQLLTMPIVLSAALTRRITLADLLMGEQSVMLNPSAHSPVLASYLREVVVGSPFKRSVSEVPHDATAMLMASNAEAVEKMRTVRAANLADVDVRTLGRAEAGSGSTEAKLARQLGVPEIIVIAAAASLWGRSLSDERDAQLREDSTLSATAVNRRLTAEVTKRINDAAAGKPAAPATSAPSSAGAVIPLRRGATVTEQRRTSMPTQRTRHQR